MADENKIKVSLDDLKNNCHVTATLSPTGFLVCPKCLMAYPAETSHSIYSCQYCRYEWQPLSSALRTAYFATLEDVDVFLEDSTGQTFLLTEFPAVVGRNSDFKALQHNVSVSRKHCLIDFDHKSGIFTVTPFKTGGGTYLNGQMLSHDVSHNIYPGDTLVLSGVVLSLKCKLKTDAPKIQIRPPAAVIYLSTTATMGFICVDELNNPFFSETCLDNAVAVIIHNQEKNTWRILSINRHKISANGNIFVEKDLNGGENFVIGNSCYVFNPTNATLTPDSPETGAEIRINNLKVSYSGIIVLGDVSCDIPQGKLTAILGQSGCGKSTLIKVLSGQKKQDSGNINVEGVVSEPYSRWANKHLSLVPQHDVVHDELTVRQCIEFAADIRLGRKVETTLKDLIVEKVIYETGLEKHKDTTIEALSGGQRKRVNIAAEAVGNPEVLLLDEPTTGLDYATEKQIITRLRQMSRQGRTVVFVTHSLATIEAADHVIVLKKSPYGTRVAAQGTPLEVQRAVGVETWEGLYSKIEDSVNVNQKTEIGKQIIYRAPGMSALFSRYLMIWLNSPISSLSLLFGLPLLLGMMIRFSVSIDAPLGTDRLVFGLVAMFWMGMNQTVREIIKEKEIFLQEHAHHISSASYLFSKLLFFFILALPQALLMTIPIMWLNINSEDFFLKFDQLTCPFKYVLIMMWAADFVGCVLGLFFSAIAQFIKKQGQTAAVLFAVIATLPQFLFSAKVLPDGLAKPLIQEHFFQFIQWHENAPVAEFFSYFTFSRYLFVPLDALSTEQPIAVIVKSFVFNGGILAIVTIILIILTWLMLDIFAVWSTKK